MVAIMRKPEPGVPPVIDVFTLARSRGHVAGQVALANLERLAPLLASVEGELNWALDAATDPRGRPAATLSIRGTVVVKCDKCGLNLALPIASDSRFWFVHTEAELNAQPIEVDDDEPLLGSRSFSVGQLIEDEMILALPISPRHAHCGTEQRPVTEPARRRALAALAGLKSRH